MEKIKKIFKNISKYLGELMIIIGVGLLIHNFFILIFKFVKSFSIEISTYTIEEGSSGLPSLPSLTEKELISEEIYTFSSWIYGDDTLLLITIGAMLIASGILILINKFKR